MTNNFDMMAKRLLHQGGFKQEDRMIQDKYRTFLKTLQYSYQGVDMRICQKYFNCDEINNNPQIRGLINPDKTKQDYDDKILSVDYSSGIEPGDIFEWCNTNSYWLVSLQALTEDAYFRSEIRRCRYKIKFKDKNGLIQETWVAIRGPVETVITSIQKNQIRVDEPNWSLNILMPLNDLTYEAFDRYKQFIFEGRCWRVEAANSISMKNVLEITAQEYYIDRDTDDIDNSLKDGLVIEPIDPTPQTLIQGPAFIRPKITETYIAPVAGGTWKALLPPDFKYCAPVTIEADEIEAKITWQKTTSGQFKLIWVSEDEEWSNERLVIVESLF